jgi:hypothetical protein
MSRPLASHVATREAVEFVINDRSQLVERGSISVAPGAKESAHIPVIGSFRRFADLLL